MLPRYVNEPKHHRKLRLPYGIEYRDVPPDNFFPCKTSVKCSGHAWRVSPSRLDSSFIACQFIFMSMVLFLCVANRDTFRFD